MSTHKDTEQPFPISVGLTATDMKATLAFYRDRLGFKLSETWPSESDPMWMSLVLDRQALMFGKAMTSSQCDQMMAQNPAAARFWSGRAAAWSGNAHGVGVNIYIAVPDVDAYAKQLARRGVEVALPPTSQFYGLRDIVLTGPDGYVLTFYTPITLSSCQSCGMPLTEAKPGQMYCPYCCDEQGHLRPYEQVFEGTVTGFFMAMQKMPRQQAEQAAREHLSKMPAWAARK